MKVPLTVGDFLDRAGLVYPDRPAIIDEADQPAPSWGTLTYAEVIRRARALAASLDRLGLGPGERVAIVSHNAARLLVTMLGSSAHGRISVPINFRLNAAEVDYIVKHSGARLLLVDPDLADDLAAVGCEHRYIIGPEADEALFGVGDTSGNSLGGVSGGVSGEAAGNVSAGGAGSASGGSEDDSAGSASSSVSVNASGGVSGDTSGDADPRPWTPDEDAIAAINYTSGTTARPKGVQMTHRTLWINAATFGWSAGVNDRDVYLHTLPMFHCNGWGMPYALTGVGATQVVIRRIDGAEILRRIERHGVTYLCGAPAVVAAVLAAAESWPGPIPGAGRVRMTVAGAPPPTRTIERMESELGWEFMQLYGLTETAPYLTMNRARPEWDELPSGERARRLARQGVPALGVSLRVSPEGEVLARGNVVMEGYWRRPDVTAEALAGGWFRTGDGGYRDDDGYLVLTDRRKDVIITGGENVSSIEVEDCLFTHPAVAEVAVIGVPDERWGETPKALVVLAPGAEVTPAELIEYCRERLAHYKCPSSVEMRDALARTATGKLQKYKLREPYWADQQRNIN